MAKLVQTLALLAFFITLFLMLPEMANSSESISFNIKDFESEQPDLLFQGDAHVPEGANFLRLTNTEGPSGLPTSYRVGRVLYGVPVRLWDTNPSRLASFETSISFVITHTNQNPADGLAFFIAPIDTTIPKGSTGGNLGLFDPNTAFDPTKNQIVAVEFDTYVNARGDPSYRHIGIDVNTLQSSAYTKWESRSKQVVNARINYNARTRRLTVTAYYPFLALQADTVTYDVDFRNVLPQWAKIGISGATGQQVAVHDILSWSFTAKFE